MLLLCHPTCTTCKKARDYLARRGFPYAERDIRAQRPSLAELTLWQQASGLPPRRFFNTSGLAYRALGLAQKLDSLSEAEQLDLLASDGMLVRRPLLVQGQTVLVGFNEQAWDQALGAGKP